MNISRKIKKQKIVVLVFLLILTHLMMRAVYDIENSLGEEETFGHRLCSALLRQGVSYSNPYLMYTNGIDQNGVKNQLLKNMPLEMCLIQKAEKEDSVTEYRQPSAIEEMAAWPIRTV